MRRRSRITEVSSSACHAEFGGLAPGWVTLSLDKMGDWIGKALVQPPPPIYELQTQRPELSVPPLLRQAGARLNWRDDSPTAELSFAQERAASTFESQPGFLEQIIGFSTQFDAGRVFQPFAPLDSSVIVADLRSSLQDSNLPIVGPGGRVSLFRSENELQADIVIRRRVRKIGSLWRSTEEIVRDFQAKLLELGGAEDIAGMFGVLGYLELSKYERQLWLRPTFFFVVDFLVETEETRLDWSSSLAVPATWEMDIELTEGLGSWA